MNQLTLKPRKPVEDAIECWDDDDLDIGGDELTFRSASLATTANSQHRESISSRLSIRSDLDSNHGDEERQVLLPGDDERATIDAIAAATKAGIPIPQNVPSSALMGGTIKRLGGRKIKKIMQDDWDDGDFSELPADGGLKIKQRETEFPDALRQVSGSSIGTSPVVQNTSQFQPVQSSSPNPGLRPKPAQSDLLNRFKDDDDDDFFGNGGDTIKVVKNRQAPKLLPLVTPPTPQRNLQSNDDDDFEHDFQFPSNNEPLRLSSRKEMPKTPSSAHDDFEWGEGSLGTRHGGTRRDGRSNRSSSASALSPSVASSITAESEDDGLDGLILPSGPLRFDDILKRKQQERSPERQPLETLLEKPSENKDDFLSGLEFGDGDVFDSSKLTLNRNVKVKAARQTSPVRPKTAVSLTFTNKPTLAPPLTSRLPRPLSSHERNPSSLEPVSESGGPIVNRVRRPASRLGGHSAQSSVNSITMPQTPTSTTTNIPSTPSRRGLTNKSSTTTLRHEPTTTNAQLLKIKRSLPTMKTYPSSPAKPLVSRYERPPSRQDGNRVGFARPKTPVDRDRSESSMSHTRKPVPFLPAGSSASSSHHVVAKTSRHFRRHDSDASNASVELRPASRAVSRSMMRSPSPRRTANEAWSRDVAGKRTLVKKPLRTRHFGDGFELDGFDDLPTSRDSEQRFVKEPVGKGPPRLNGLRRVQETLPARGTTPAPQSPARTSELPRFARDTNASRMAREHSLAQRAPSAQGAPLAALTNQWKAKVAATTGLSAVNAHSIRTKKPKEPPQKLKLIKPMGNVNNPRSIKGMFYNPTTFRWEGNENDLSPFDAPTSSPMIPSARELQKQPSNSHLRDTQSSTPRPALIQNVNSSMNVQVVGGMVFDPQRMCWLKMPASATSQKSGGRSDMGDTMDGFDAFDDEEDVFKDVPDLEDKVEKNEEGIKISGRRSESGSKAQDEWLVGEEFDVGPEFIRRQREEEERWRRKCEKWIDGSVGRRGGEEWRWSIRDVINE